MADVTVEFGAKDVGFEKVLSQVREESARLKNSLKGTELAMEDIEDIMRKIGRNDAMEKRIRSLGNTLDDTKKKTEGFANSGGLVRDFATGFAFTEIISGTKQLMNEFDRIGDLAVRFDTSAETIQRVGAAAKLSGSDIESVAGAMTKAGIAATNAADNGGEMAEKFAKAGINAREFANADLDKKLLMISQAYQNAAGDASKLNAIISIMGSKGGANLIPLISNLDELTAAMEGASIASNDTVASIQKANDEIDKMTMTLKTWGAGLVSFLVDTVQSAGERVGNILAGGVGKTIKELDADVERLNAKARLASKGVAEPKAGGISIPAAGAGAFPMFGSSLKPQKSTETLDYEKQVADEIAAMKEEAAAREKAAADKIASDKIAAIEKVRLAELNVSKDAPQVQAVLKVLGTDSVEDAKGKLLELDSLNGESVIVKLKAEGIESIANAQNILNQVLQNSNLITLTNEYSANLEGISATTNDANVYLSDQSLILNENLSLTESIAGKTDDNTQYLEDQTKQLEIVKGLYEDISTAENEGQKKHREKQEEKAKNDLEQKQKKATQEAQQAYDSSLTGQAYNQIGTAKKEYKVTQGGVLRDRMNKSMERGDFNTAEIYAGKIAKNEADYEKRQVSSMVKNRGMTQTEAQAAVSSEKSKNDPMGTLVKQTTEINASVKTIAEKLPQKALKE